jgi:hypothetical protein
MNTIFIVFVAYYLNLFDVMPHHIVASVGIMLRVLSKRIRGEFDIHHSQKQIWLLIHERFVPNITGLPPDLKTVYYLKLIRNFFAPLNIPSDDMAKRVDFFVNVLNDDDKSDGLKTTGLLKSNYIFTRTADGRAYLLGIIDDVWKRISDDGLKRGILNTIRNFLRYSFRINYGCVVETNLMDGPYDCMRNPFDDWRC